MGLADRCLQVLFCVFGCVVEAKSRTRLVDSLFRITCRLENNAFSVLYYVIKVALHYCMLYRFEIHSSLELPRTAVLGSSLSSGLQNTVELR